MLLAKPLMLTRFALIRYFSQLDISSVSALIGLSLWIQLLLVTTVIDATLRIIVRCGIQVSESLALIGRCGMQETGHQPRL